MYYQLNNDEYNHGVMYNNDADYYAYRRTRGTPPQGTTTTSTTT